MKTIFELASELSNMFEVAKRTTTDKEFIRVKSEFSQQQDKENSPLFKLIYRAHNYMPPDDYKYQFIVEALDAIAEAGDNKIDLDDLTIEPDISNYELFEWLCSHMERESYCDEVIEEYGEGLKFMQIVQYAQQREKQEVLFSVRCSLERILESK